MTSVAEARVIEAATALAANVTAIRKLNKEIRGAECAQVAAWCARVEAGENLEPVETCVFRKVEIGCHPEDGPEIVLPWYHFDGVRDRGRGYLSAKEIGERYGYCPECVLQVDRFRERKRLKAKKGGLFAALVRVVAIMEKKAGARA